MSIAIDFDPALEDLGVAIGLLKTGAGGTTLDASFFSAPWNHVSQILSDATQRAALVNALEALIPPADPSLLDPADPGAQRNAYPLLEAGQPGQIYIVCERASAAPGADLSLAVLAEVQAANGGPSALAELTLLTAHGSTLSPAFATEDHPLRIEARAPLGTSGAVAIVSLRGVAPPHADQTRFVIQLVGLPGETGVLELDFSSGIPPISRLLTALLEAALSEVGTSAPPAVQRVAAALPPMLGLSSGMPPLPLEQLTHDAGALRSWFTSLATTQVAGRPALVEWLDAIGKLLGAPPIPTPPPAATEDDPVVLTILSPGTAPGVSILAGLRTDAATGAPVLVLGLRVEMASTAVNAALRAEAMLVALPLSGTTPATVLERIDVRIDAPITSAPLVSGAAGALTIQSLRAGLRYAPSAAGPTVVPLLELIDVDVTIAGKTTHFDALDFTDAGTLTSAAETLLDNALSAGLGAAGDIVNSLRTLLGLVATSPRLDVAAFASNPGAALATYYRALRATPDGWKPVLLAVGKLLGSSVTQIDGTGTADDPWCLDLDTFVAPAGSNLKLRAAVWDVGDATSPSLRLALRVETSVDTLKLSAHVQLLQLDLPMSGTGALRWLGDMRADIQWTPPATPPLAGLSVGASGVHAGLRWSAGAPLAFVAEIQDIALTADDGTTVTLGTLVLPTAGLNPSAPDLGLGLDANAVWDAARLLLSRCASSWSGGTARALLAMLGIAAPATPGISNTLPQLALPTDGDLLSLLRAPLEAVRIWLASVVSDGASSLTEEGEPFIAGLLRVAHSVLTNRLITLDGGLPVPDVPMHGVGTPGDPWALPLQPAVGATAPVEVLVWIEPDGPPATWSIAAADAFLHSDVAAPDIIDAAAVIADAMPSLSDALAARDREDAGDSLRTLAALLLDSDGVVMTDGGTPSTSDWEIGTPVVEAHHLVPGNDSAVRQVQDAVQAWTTGVAASDWAVLLLAPPFAGSACWNALLEGVADTDKATIDLNVPGTPAAQVDLGGIPAVQWYTVDLGDDGSDTLANVTALLSRTVDAVRAIKPGARVVLVAHSYLALVARAYASASSGNLIGVVALAAPLGTGEILPFTDAAIAEGARLSSALVPNGVDGSAGDAVALLAALLEGYRTENAGEPPIAAPFNVSAFARGSGQTFDLQGLPALAIAGAIDNDLCDALASALRLQTQIGADRRSPTHLAWGVRTGVNLPAAVDGDPDVDLDISLVWGRVALTASAPAPSVEPSIVVRARIARPGGWLVGGPGDGAALAARIRWAELVATVAASGGSTDVTIDVRLHDVALRGAAAIVVGLDDPRGPELFNALIQELDSSAAANGRLDALLDLLAGAGLVRRATSSTPTAVLADGFAAIANDGAGTLGPVIASLLDASSGLFGIARGAGVAAGGGPWRLAFDPLPVELVVEKAPWRVTVHTTGSGLPIGPDCTLTATGTVSLTDLTPTFYASVSVGPTSVGQTAAGSPVVLASPFLDAPLTLVPGDPAAIAAALVPALPRLIIGGALSALIEQYAGGALTAASIDQLLRDPGGWFARGGGIGDGTLPLAAPVNALLTAVAKLTGLSTTPTEPLVLPGDIGLKATDTGAGTSRHFGLELATKTPIPLWSSGGNNATLALTLDLDLDQTRHVLPGGTLRLHVPLPGAWGAIDLTFGADPSGLLAKVTTTSGVNLTLLPTLSGLDTLVSAAAQQLLAEVLDQLAVALGGMTPRPAALDDALAIAKSFGVYDDTAAAGQGFKTKAAALRQLVTDVSTGNIVPLANGIATAISTLLTRLFGTTVIAPALGAGQVGLQFGGVLGGTVAVTVDLTTTPPGIHARLQGLAAGAVTVGADAGFTAGALTFGVDVGAALDTGLGLVLTPSVSAGLDTTYGPRLSIEIKPLGTNDVVITLAPTPAAPTLQDIETLAERWLVPLAGTLILRAADTFGVLAHSVWPGATKTVGDLLVSMKIATGSPTALALASPLPTPPVLLKGLLDGLTGAQVPLPGDFKLQVVSDGARYGLAVSGAQDFAVGDYSVGLMLGVPQTLDPGWGPTGNGVGFLLLDLTTPTLPQLSPVLRLGGLGVRVANKDPDSPLINEGGFQLGAAAAYLRADLALSGAGAPKLSGSVYGAAELDGLGLVIGAGDNNSNPVAGSLLQRSRSGDPSPANPPFDLLVATSGAGWAVEFSGEAKLRIEVKRSFGPLYIDEIDLLYQAVPQRPGNVGFGITGGVSLAGLVLQADDLELLVPLDHPSELDRWSVDLGGLALSLETSAVTVAGGLLKAVLPGGVIDYEGMLSVQVAGRSFTALGAYSRPSDPQLGPYTSLFVFVAISTPIGGPPYFFVTGLAGGLGLNRRLLTPRDPASVPSFPLVAAMTGAVASDPMGALQTISRDIPPSRGSFWLAAGLQFSTFEILNTTALLCVSLDHGLDVTLLGLMRLALPEPEAAVVSLELALAAKYSTVDQVLSVRAGLTNNSWLISEDCRLTGGFAFVAWFHGRPESVDKSPEVMLSIGGYSRKFIRPPSYPDVPRVGFHWDVGGGIVIKGESFFALTHSAMMLGGALEASYDVSPIKVWFSADLDVIIWWDPFHYDAEASVSIGAQFHFEVCFFACATISVSVTLGASLHIVGPPLHGVVVVDLAIASVTVEFGSYQAQPYLTWPEVSLKYLSGATAGAPATNASVMSGAAPVKRSKDPDGSETSPWAVSPEFALRVESKMPSTSWQLGAAAVNTSPLARAWYDLVPADTNFGNVHARLNITLERKAGSAWNALSTVPLDAAEAKANFPGAVWDASSLGDGTTATPMVGALGALELRAPVVSTEATGALTDIPFSTMVEEEPARSLTFGSPSTTPLMQPRRAARRATRAVAAPTPASPRLRAVVQPTRAMTQPTMKVLTPAALGEPLARGGFHLWDVDPTSAHDVTIHSASAPVRVTALNGAGGLVADAIASRGKAVAPQGASSVIVGEAPNARVAGWEIGTPLLRLNAGTLLAPGATVHLSRPWVPPARSGTPLTNGDPRWIKASLVTAEVDAIVTRFPHSHGPAPKTIVVRLDRIDADARIDQVTVDCEGGTLGDPNVVQSDTRVDLVYSVRTPSSAGADAALSVRVESGAQWRLSGVVAPTETPRTCARALALPHARLQQITPRAPANKQTGIVVKPKLVRKPR